MNVTRLLQRLQDGDEAARKDLYPLVYAELHRLARHHMLGERPGHTLQTTALVHEAYLKLTGGEPADFQSRAHFLAVASSAMRQILIDHARARSTQKQGGGRERQPLEAAVAYYEEHGIDLLALHDALTGLAQADAELARLVELHFFAGLTFPEIAAVLGRSERTIHARWCLARAWLKERMGASG